MRNTGTIIQRTLHLVVASEKFLARASDNRCIPDVQCNSVADQGLHLAQIGERQFEPMNNSAQRATCRATTNQPLPTDVAHTCSWSATTAPDCEQHMLVPVVAKLRLPTEPVVFGRPWNVIETSDV